MYALVGLACHWRDSGLVFHFGISRDHSPPPADPASLEPPLLRLGERVSLLLRLLAMIKWPYDIREREGIARGI